MKTILAIPLLVLILFTGIRVDIGTHYCGGSVAATKVSLDGELASCGMEKSAENNSTEQIFTHHCCDDIVNGFTICNNYFPSTYNSQNPYQTDFNLFITNSELTVAPETISQKQFTSIRPPGYFSSSSVVLSDICIYRI